MAVTYTPIASGTITSSGSFTFSSIPSTYTDLVIIVNGISVGGGPEFWLNFNGDTAGNYSRTYVLGDGTSAVSGRSTSATNYAASSINSVSTNIIYNIMNYSNTTTFKPIISKSALPNGYVVANTGTWRSTAAITSCAFTASNTIASATLTLYGIKSA